MVERLVGIAQTMFTKQESLSENNAKVRSDTSYYVILLLYKNVDEWIRFEMIRFRVILCIVLGFNQFNI